jgi:myosin heavy subunit
LLLLRALLYTCNCNAPAQLHTSQRVGVQIKTRDELIVKPLTAQEAVEARDALAKALYAGVFTWIVAAINNKLDMGKKASGRFIAILDIYGFEQFQTNRCGCVGCFFSAVWWCPGADACMMSSC